MANTDKEKSSRPFEDHPYVGNIWGWKFSIFGALLMISLLALSYYLARSRNMPLFDHTQQQVEQQDSIK